MSKIKNVVIYARVSSVNDRQNNERQINDLTAYAVKGGYNIVKTYEEKVSGAKLNSERPVLMECLEYCKDKKNKVDCLMVSELSRLGRNTFQVLETIKGMIDSKVNIYLQKEQFLLLDENDKPSTFAPILIATLGTCAELERENIQYRLNSGRAMYINNGGRLGRTPGAVKTKARKEMEYAEVIKLLKKQYPMTTISKLTNTSVSTIQRLKREFFAPNGDYMSA